MAISNPIESNDNVQNDCCGVDIGTDNLERAAVIFCMLRSTSTIYQLWLDSDVRKKYTNFVVRFEVPFGRRPCQKVQQHWPKTLTYIQGISIMGSEVRWLSPLSLSSTYLHLRVEFGVSYTKKVHVRTGQFYGLNQRTLSL